jgi:hypothetical protein
MIVFGIASAVSRDVADFFTTEEEAAAVLQAVIADAPDLEGLLWVERVELSEEAEN